eukprot:55983-Eustigmatos_ZCMA.PRE.1
MVLNETELVQEVQEPLQIGLTFLERCSTCEQVVCQEHYRDATGRGERGDQRHNRVHQRREVLAAEHIASSSAHFAPDVHAHEAAVSPSGEELVEGPLQIALGHEPSFLDLGHCVVHACIREADGYRLLVEPVR